MIRMPTETTTWRELFRSDDLTLTQSVLVSVLSMEFEARLRALGTPPRATVGGARSNDDDESVGSAPFVIEVRDQDWYELAEVLDQIVDEQESFDRDVEHRQRERMLVGAVFLLAVVAAGGLLWAAERHAD